MLVKNFKTGRKQIDPKAYLDATWQKIQVALDSVFSRGKIDFSLEELYRDVENLCRQGVAQETYKRLEGRCRAYAMQIRDEKIAETAGRKDVDVLRATLQAWATWMGQMKYVETIFCYLDRSYLLPKHQSLHEVAVALFRSVVFESPKLSDRIINGACDLIAVDREGKDLDRETFKKAIRMFHDMVVYTKFFEPRMLQHSQEYITEWAGRESAQRSLAEYVRAARALMTNEMGRAELFSLDGSTRRDLLTLLEDHLISKKEARLSGSNPSGSCIRLLLTISQPTRTTLPTSSKTMRWKIWSRFTTCLNAANSVFTSAPLL